MTNDEIKKALLLRCPIRHRNRAHETAIVYAYAQAWRVSVNYRGEFISSLELVTGGNVHSLTVAAIEECELLEDNK